ncbi:MAG: hypothetical protein ACO3UU_13680, partial [Minisyncoccia bacterium]
METLIPTQEQIKPLSEYRYTEIIDSIYNKPDENIDNNLDQELNTLLFQKKKEADSLQTLIASSEKQSSNPRVQRQINTFKQNLEGIQASKKVYEACKELNLYHLEETLELENDSVEFLLERYRTYQTLLNSLDESESNSSKI